MPEVGHRLQAQEHAQAARDAFEAEQVVAVGGNVELVNNLLARRLRAREECEISILKLWITRFTREYYIHRGLARADPTLPRSILSPHLTLAPQVG